MQPWRLLQQGRHMATEAVTSWHLHASTHARRGSTCSEEPVSMPIAPLGCRHPESLPRVTSSQLHLKQNPTLAPPGKQNEDSFWKSTHAFDDRWLVGSWRTASSFSSSSLFLRVVGTEREGSCDGSCEGACSSNPKRLCIMPDGGDVNCEPERAGRFKRPGGEVRLDME